MSFAFYSGKNYMRRHSSTGSQAVAAPSNSESHGFTTDITVNHGLGYVPVVRVYFDSANNGRLYPAGGNPNGGTYWGLSSNSVYCLFTVDTNNLYIQLVSNTSKVGTRDVYYVVYENEAV